MDGFDESVMVALIPVRKTWSRLELPHLTLVYAGELKQVGPSGYNELCKAALTIAHTFKPVIAMVTGVDQFGTDDRVDVLTFEMSPELEGMRAVVEQWNASQHPFNPHGTIGPPGAIVGLTVPQEVVFDRVTVGYGDHFLTYGLGKENTMQPGM